jgi:hypothetical protein
MARLHHLFWTTGLSVILASAVLPGCGDDEGDEDGTGGKGGSTTGGKGGSTGGSKGGTGGKTTGGTDQGGEAGAPVSTGGTGATGGEGGGAAGEPGTGGTTGGKGGTGGTTGGTTPMGGGGSGADGGVSGEGGIGGSDGGVSGEGGVGGSDGGAAGAPSVLTCTASDDWPNGVGATCDSYCADFFAVCDTYGPTDDVYTSVDDCETECAAFTEASLCCRGALADDAADDTDPVGNCEGAAAQTLCD